MQASGLFPSSAFNDWLVSDWSGWDILKFSSMLLVWSFTINMCHVYFCILNRQGCQATSHIAAQMRMPAPCQRTTSGSYYLSQSWNVLSAVNANRTVVLWSWAYRMRKGGEGQMGWLDERGMSVLLMHALHFRTVKEDGTGSSWKKVSGHLHWAQS